MQQERFISMAWRWLCFTFLKNSPALLVFSSFRTTGLRYPVFVCFLGRLLAAGSF
nr:MAG TPA: hypothetical protein [Caudoviricetes sp.]